MPLAHRFIPLKCFVVMGAMTNVPGKTWPRYGRAGSERERAEREGLTHGMRRNVLLRFGEVQNLKPSLFLNLQSDETRRSPHARKYQEVTISRFRLIAGNTENTWALQLVDLASETGRRYISAEESIWSAVVNPPRVVFQIYLNLCILIA